MNSLKLDFDYESVLETYGLQGENVKKASETNIQSDSQYHMEYNNYKKLKKERKSKHDNLLDTLLKQRKHSQKLNRLASKQSMINKQIANLQELTATMNSELQKQSDELMKKIATMDEDLQKLYSQFEGKTLTNIITDVSNDLSSSENIKKHLHKENEKIKNQQVNLEAYDRYPVVRMFSNELGDHQNINDIKKKISEKKKNIQVLKTETDKIS